MDECCEIEDLAKLRRDQTRVLKVVLAINVVMFVVEAWAGVVARSTALLADSLDMLGDAVVYGFSLFVVSRSASWQASAALLKGIIMAIFGAGILAEATVKAMSGPVPAAAMMTGFGFLALFANLVCLALLSRHRKDNLNMRSTWICSRNDIVANVGVLLAAAAVSITHSRWPDVVIGATIAAVILVSAVRVLRASIASMRENRSR